MSNIFDLVVLNLFINRSFDDSTWGAFDNNDDVDSVWGFNPKVSLDFLIPISLHTEIYLAWLSEYTYSNDGLNRSKHESIFHFWNLAFPSFKMP